MDANIPPISELLAPHSAIVVLLTPADMKRLHSDWDGQVPCPWACWAASVLPLVATANALSRPQDAEILVTRDPNELRQLIANHPIVTFSASDLPDFVTPTILLSEIEVPPYGAFGDLLHLVLTVNRRSVDRHPRACADLTPHDLLRMVTSAASAILFERHRKRAGNPISAATEEFFLEATNPSRTIVELELSRRELKTLALATDGPILRRLPGTADVNAHDPDPGTLIGIIHRIAEDNDARAMTGIALPPYLDTHHGRRPSIGARLSVSGLVPAWIGRRTIATAMHLARGLLTLELTAFGELVMTGWHLHNETLDPLSHAAIVPELRPVTMQVDRLLNFNALRAMPLEGVRRTLIEAFVRDVNPRLEAPFRLLFSNHGFGSHDERAWETTAALISDIVAADPDLAAAAPLRYSVMLPADPDLGRARIFRNSLSWTGERPPVKAIHRFLVLANAALRDVKGWGYELGTQGTAHPCLTLNAETQSPRDILGTAADGVSFHESIEASARVGEFWRAARAGLSFDASECLPDGRPIAPGTIEELDAMYRPEAEPV